MSTPSARNAGRTEYRIQVKPAVPFTKHSTLKSCNSRGINLHGVTFILGAPIAPSSKWFCGTDVVWPVLEVNGAAINFDPGKTVVCRHQIQIGD